jgi:hypothetical protein
LRVGNGHRGQRRPDKSGTNRHRHARADEQGGDRCGRPGSLTKQEHRQRDGEKRLQQLCLTGARAVPADARPLYQGMNPTNIEITDT